MSDISLTTIDVLYADTDAGGVVYYANYLRFFEAARTEWLTRRGCPISEWHAAGRVFTVVRQDVDYFGSARYGDRLEITTDVIETRRVRLTLRNEIRRAGEDKVLVAGVTTLAYIELGGKAQPLPAAIRGDSA